MQIKYVVIAFVLILFLTSYYDFNISLLFFFIFFQIVSVFGIINNIKTYLKTRKGIFVKGAIKETRKIKSEESTSDNYEYLIEFNFPKDENKHFISHKESTQTPRIEDYTIWVNQENIEQSVVIETFNPHWVYMLCIFTIVIIALSFADFLLIKKIVIHIYQ